MNASRLAWFWLAVAALAAIASPSPDFNLDRALEFPRDAFGRDLFLLTSVAARGSVAFALATLAITCAVALLVTGFLALSSPRARELAERILDFFMAFPSLLIALAGQAVMGTGSTTLILSLGLGLLPSVIRFLIVRAREVLAEEYVSAAWALGSGKSNLLSRHLLPALLEHLRLKLPFLFAQAIGVEATLSFLGLGVSPGSVTWGALLAQGKDYLIEAPYISWIVGLPLLFTLLAFMTIESQWGRRKSPVS